MTTTIDTVKDLTKEAPRSPRERIGGYILLARAADKGRALLHSNPGEYHFACPLDTQLFEFKGVSAEEFKAELVRGASDLEIAVYLDTHGTPKTAEEIRAWSESLEKSTMHGDPEKGDWFDGECRKLGLDPAKTSTFDWLEADDRASFAVSA